MHEIRSGTGRVPCLRRTVLFLLPVLLSVLLLFGAACTVSAETQTENGYQVVRSLDEAASVVRQAMVERKGTIRIQYATSNPSGIETKIFNKALEHTGKGNEGDYLDCSWSYMKYSTKKTKEDGKTTEKITFTLKYYTTAEQEAKVTSKVNSVLTSLNLAGKSDYQKAKAISDWISRHVSYDWDSYGNESKTQQYTAYSALFNGKATCQGFASLFYRMALDSGLDARCILGTFNKESHRWNIVKINERWYNVDLAMEKDGYFLKCDSNKNYKGHHVRNSEYNTDSFKKAHPMSSMDYDGKNLYCAASVKLSKASCYYSGKAKKPSVTVKVNGTTLKKGTDYTVSYKNNTEPGSASVSVSGKGKYSGTVSKTFKIKLHKPTITSIKNTSQGITLRWKKATGADGYYIYRKTSSGKYKRIKTVKSGSALKYTDKTAKNGKKYKYSIRAYRGKTKSAASRKSIRRK